MRFPAAALASVLIAVPVFCPAHTTAQIPAQTPAQMQRAAAPFAANRDHASAEWANIAAHLPDPATASVSKVESAGDTLRARRYPTDALQMYRAALARGAAPELLLQKMGVTCLELQEILLAKSYFQRATKLNKKNASAWNNLGAAEFILRDTHSAVHDYKRAVKLEKNSAVYHSNLALAYFSEKHAGEARRELATALQLDPELLHKKTDTGYTAQVLASENYSEICFEMARIYAAQGDIRTALDWLVKAGERGYDLRKQMDKDAALRPLLADARVKVILENTDTLRAKVKAPPGIPSLGSSADH